VASNKYIYNNFIYCNCTQKMGEYSYHIRYLKLDTTEVLMPLLTPISCLETNKGTKSVLNIFYVIMKIMIVFYSPVKKRLYLFDHLPT
jgi:hypothetical protein